MSAVCAARQGLSATHYEGTVRFNLRAFWAEYKLVLPIHYAAYLAEVGCKKAAAANVETVFSGSGKFTDEANAPCCPGPIPSPIDSLARELRVSLARRP